MDANRINQKKREIIKKTKQQQHTTNNKKAKPPHLYKKNALLLKSELYKIGSTLPKLCLEKKQGGWWKKGKVFQQHQSILFCVVKIFFNLETQTFCADIFLFAWHNFENEKNKAIENPHELNTDQLPLLFYCPISFLWKILKVQALFQSGTKHVLKSQNALWKRMLTHRRSYCSQTQVDLQREPLGPRLLHQSDKPTRNMKRITSFHSFLHWKEREGQNFFVRTP